MLYNTVKPKISADPYPVGPINPVAWQSSTKTSELYFLASSMILSKGAMSPSMLKTPSVAMSLNLHLTRSASKSCFSKLSILRWSNRNLCALHKRIPSMIDAWLSESLITASCSERTASKKPVLAS